MGSRACTSSKRSTQECIGSENGLRMKGCLTNRDMTARLSKVDRLVDLDRLDSDTSLEAGVRVTRSEAWTPSKAR